MRHPIYRYTQRVSYREGCVYPQCLLGTPPVADPSSVRQGGVAAYLATTLTAQVTDAIYMHISVKQSWIFNV